MHILPVEFASVGGNGSGASVKNMNFETGRNILPRSEERKSNKFIQLGINSRVATLNGTFGSSPGITDDSD